MPVSLVSPNSCRAPLLCLVVLAVPGASAAEAPAGGADAVDGGVAAVRLAPRLKANPLGRRVNEARVERVMASMTPRARVAQLLIAYPQVKSSTPVEVGGVLFVGSSLRSLSKARDRVKSSVARALVPPFVAMDMEGGPSNRMKAYPGLSALPGAREMALMGDDEVQALGKQVGAAMRDLGFNMNLAPVLDVAGTGHMARNGRAFSGDPEAVLAKATAFARGLLEVGVVPFGKHYPGYGDAEGDSDHALVEVDLPLSQVTAHAELFRRAAPVLGGVMMANLVYRQVEQKPAILSPVLVANAHKKGFLTMTDDISIALLAESVGGTSEQVLNEAFLAGNDLLLTTAPPDWDKGLDYVGLLEKLAAKSVENTQRADDACRRVLTLKDKMGLLEGL